MTTAKQHKEDSQIDSKAQTRARLRVFWGRFAGQMTLTHVVTTFVILLITVTLYQGIAYVYGVRSLNADFTNLSKGLESYSQRISGSAELDNNLAAVSEAIVFLRELRSVDRNSVFLLTDGQGIIIQSNQQSRFPLESALADHLNASNQAVLEDALAGESSKTTLRVLKFNIFNNALMAVPIFGADQQIRATLAIHQRVTFRSFVLDFLENLLWVLLIFLVIAIPIIFILSRKQASQIALRLNHLERVAENWAQADFRQFIKDDKQDELSDLSRNLNSMAEQFQSLLASKEELAIIQERNRLAIELHDSVKQQIFAIGLKIATLESNKVHLTKERLTQIQSMLQNVKEELNRLIHELRPSELEREDFLLALRRYVSNWSQQHAISVDLSHMGATSLEEAVEEVFFRVAQEALANILKHSGATSVQMMLDFSQAFSMHIADNGSGFDLTKKNAGIGLTVMRERIENLGGSFSLESHPKQGSCIEINYPGKTRKAMTANQASFQHKLKSRKLGAP